MLFHTNTARRITVNWAYLNSQLVSCVANFLLTRDVY